MRSEDWRRYRGVLAAGVAAAAFVLGRISGPVVSYRTNHGDGRSRNRYAVVPAFGTGTASTFPTFGFGFSASTRSNWSSAAEAVPGCSTRAARARGARSNDWWRARPSPASATTLTATGA